MSDVIARMEGGPFDGYARPLPTELRPIPILLAIRDCPTQPCPLGAMYDHLHVRDITLNPDLLQTLDGFVAYRLAAEDTDGVLYRYGDLIRTIPSEFAEAYA